MRFMRYWFFCFCFIGLITKTNALKGAEKSANQGYSNFAISVAAFFNKQESTVNYIINTPYTVLTSYKSNFGRISPRLTASYFFRKDNIYFKTRISLYQIRTHESYEYEYLGSPSYPYPSSSSMKSLRFRYDILGVSAGPGLSFGKSNVVVLMQYGLVLSTLREANYFNGAINHEENERNYISINKKNFFSIGLEYNYNISPKWGIGIEGFYQFKITDESYLDFEIYGFGITITRSILKK